ncbi:group II intron reverse transcriptase/maturase [Marinithermofilum abyssi]|uniref:RNA-directed DNA polymerase n=1 Tax=Marinithermofilum abyssi TaxID=1571185 RepID=A0A8J2VIX9_9BACL|nr:group II intron reverse transcriptase/maturase [Marinithermofilum abyssi]
MDGVDVKTLKSHLQTHWAEIREDLRQGTYQPAPVRGQDIPKPGGGVRRLGIPTTTDRLIQQAILQVLTPLFDPDFSESSFGFRPGRRAQDAIQRAKGYIEAGYRVVVDLDLKQFFDRVNHDMLMARIARKVTDKRLLKLIRAYLKAGILHEGVSTRRVEGTPQGGPLSPLLANILLDELDKELERRGLRFVRYADDFRIFVRSFRAGERVKVSVTRFLEQQLKLQVNQEKSGVDRPWRRSLLGFSFYVGKKVGIRLAPETVQRLKGHIRELTRRNRSQPMNKRIQQLNRHLKGWLGYFALADARKILQELDGWIRHRLRACVWTQWKRVRTRLRKLRAFGLSEHVARMVANTRKGPWRAAMLLNNVLNRTFWANQGLVSLEQQYVVLRQTR